MTLQSIGRHLLFVWLLSLIAASQARDIDVSGCGKSKGCFRSPDGCETPSCKFLLTWNTGGSNNEVFFEMSAPVDSRSSWVAFGLSEDAKMGSDSVIGCVYDEASGRVKIEASWNFANPLRNRRLSDPQLGIVSSGQNTSVDNGRISCSFSRMKRVSDARNQVLPIDSGVKYHILMAVGTALQGSKTQHGPTQRIASSAAVDLTTVAGAGGDADSGKRKTLLTKIHGIMMVAAWCVFASFGILLPRYYKSTWDGSTCCGKAIWFQIHQPFMIATLFVTTAAFIVVFVAVDGYSQLPSPGVAHPPLGICVMALVLINPIMAICRPTPEAERRWIFNLLHFSVGFLAQLASATAVFLGLWQFGLSDWTMIIMAVLVGFHIIVEFILIIHNNAHILCKCCFRKKYSLGEEFAMERLDEPRKAETSTASYASDIFKTMILLVHLVVVGGLAVVLMVKIGTHDGPQRGPDILSTLE